jgi:hypothetical protein
MMGSELLIRNRRGFGARRAALLANALCLDAPLVCALWAAALAVAFRVTLDVRASSLLFAGVWLGYLADRLADGLRVPPERAGTFRHRFAIRHRAPLIVLWGLVAAAAACLAPAWLGRDLRLVGVAIAAIAAGHTYLVHRWPGTGRRWVPRELLVGVLLAAAAACFAWGGWPKPWTLPAVGAVALLFTLDCWAISLAEAGVDRLRGEASLANGGRGGQSAFRAASFAFVALCAAGAIWSGDFRPLYASSAFGAIGLWLLSERSRDRELFALHCDLVLCMAAAPMVLC